jgi:hypothetical protein
MTQDITVTLLDDTVAAIDQIVAHTNANLPHGQRPTERKDVVHALVMLGYTVLHRSGDVADMVRGRKLQ